MTIEGDAGPDERWEQRGLEWWLINDRLNTEDGPHAFPSEIEFEPEGRHDDCTESHNCGEHPQWPLWKAAVTQAVRELDEEHAPTWVSDLAKDAGKDPIGCRMCFPSDGSWPCITRMIANDLRALLS